MRGVMGRRDRRSWLTVGIRAAAILLPTLAFASAPAAVRPRQTVVVGAVGQTLETGGRPLAIVTDASAGRAFVLNGNNTVSTIDTQRVVVARTVTVSGVVSSGSALSPQPLVVDAHTGRVFVLRQLADAVAVLDAHTGAVVGGTPVRRDPFLLAIDPARDRVFVLGYDDQLGTTWLTVLDARNGMAQRTVRLPDQHQATGVDPTIDDASPPFPQGLAVDSRLDRLFVVTPSPTDHYGTNLGHGSLTVIDASSGKTLRVMPLATYPTLLAVDEALGRVFVSTDSATDSTNPAPGAVWMLDAGSGRVMARTTVGYSTSGLALDPARGRLFVLDPTIPLRAPITRRSVSGASMSSIAAAGGYKRGWSWATVPPRWPSIQGQDGCSWRTETARV